MSSPLIYWKKLYEQLRENAICVDIERTSFNGPIAVVGLYEPKDGIVECRQFIRGKDLNAENLRKTLSRYKLLVTYNGLYYDIPVIEHEFPGTFAHDRKVLDLYLLSRKLQVTASLKTWENTLGIERPNGQIRKGTAIKLWQRFERYNDRKALQLLLEYNRQDTVNLYPLAERLMKFVGEPTAIVLENWR